EVALAVHEADRDQREREGRRLLEDVAGERAEAARVDRELAVPSECGAEVRDRVLRRGGTLGVRAAEILRDGALERGDALEQRMVARGAVQGFLFGFLEQPDGVLAAAVPAVRIDRAVDVVAAGRPGP